MYLLDCEHASENDSHLDCHLSSPGVGVFGMGLACHDMLGIPGRPVMARVSGLGLGARR